MLTGMVLEQQAVVGAPSPPPPRATLADVATARTGRARIAKEARRENIFAKAREMLNDCKSCLLKTDSELKSVFIAFDTHLFPHLGPYEGCVLNPLVANII